MLSADIQQLFECEIDASNRIPGPDLDRLPAFLRALDVHRSLREFEKAASHDMYSDEFTLPMPKMWVHEPHIPQVPAAWTFLDSLPSVGVRRIPKLDGTCPICTNDYTGSTDQDEEAPVARRLPCGHLLCQSCMEQWFAAFTEEPKSSCPMCRRQFFQPMPIGHLQAISDLADHGIKSRNIGRIRNLKEHLLIEKTLLLHRCTLAAVAQLHQDMTTSDAWRRNEGFPDASKFFRDEGGSHPGTFRADELPIWQEFMLRQAVLIYFTLQVFRRRSDRGEEEFDEDSYLNHLFELGCCLKVARVLRGESKGIDGLALTVTR